MGDFANNSFGTVRRASMRDKHGMRDKHVKTRLQTTRAVLRVR